MMSREPVWRSAAREDLTDAIAWYADQSFRVAERFAIAIDLAVNLLLENPHRHPFSAPGFRWARVKGFPYQINYAEVAEQVVIFAVWHEKRDPDVLNQRLRQTD
jgi:plasmid stabilization system protein ParE